MSAIHQASAASAASILKQVTVGTDGGPPIFSGYSSIAGSLAPNATVKNTTINNIGSAIGEYDMRITLLTTTNASFFRALRFQDADGNYQTLTTASATFADNTWTWGDGSSPYWSAGDNTEVKVVEIQF